MVEHQISVKLSVRNPDPLVKYQYTKPIVLNEDSIILNGHMNTVNFHIPTLVEEVKKVPKKERREFRKVCKALIATNAGMMTLLPLRSMANTSIPTTTNLPKAGYGLPPELLGLMLKLLVIAVGTGVILAAIMLVFAGVMRMFRKRKEANEWTVDIIKSLIQILVAVPVVFLIYYVSTLLFGGSGWHVNPF